MTTFAKKVGGRGWGAQFSGHSFYLEDLSTSEPNAANSLFCPAPAVSLDRAGIRFADRKI